MRVGLAQMEIAFEDKEQNKATCREFCARAAQAGVDLLLFPEMTLTGFSMHPERTGEREADSPTLAFFREQAQAHKLALCFGYVEASGQRAENRCVILDKTGKTLASYAKIHPFSYGAEAKFFQGGTQLVFVPWGDVTLAPTICYDLRFPELYQALSHRAQLITVIANWPTVRAAHWRALLQARAIENQCFIAAVNACGRLKNQEYPGDSCLIDPYGNLLTPVTHTPQLLTAEVNFDLVRQYRSEFPLKNDRREELYRSWYAPAPKEEPQ